MAESPSAPVYPEARIGKFGPKDWGPEMYGKILEKYSEVCYRWGNVCLPSMPSDFLFSFESDHVIPGFGWGSVGSLSGC